MIRKGTNYLGCGRVSCCGSLWLIHNHSAICCTNGSNHTGAGRCGKEVSICVKLALIFLCRLIAVARLFRIILDITNSTFVIDDQQWRVNIVDIFYYYFNTLWSDEKVQFLVTYKHNATDTDSGGT